MLSADATSVKLEEGLLLECMNAYWPHQDMTLFHYYPFTRMKKDISPIWTRFTLGTKLSQGIQESFWKLDTRRQVLSTSKLSWTIYMQPTKVQDLTWMVGMKVLEHDAGGTLSRPQ